MHTNFTSKSFLLKGKERSEFWPVARHIPLGKNLTRPKLAPAQAGTRTSTMSSIPEAKERRGISFADDDAISR